MSTFQTESNDWVNSLPTFEGIYSKQTTTILRPFSRFSISSLFRSSTPTLPPTTLLTPLIRIATTSSTDPLPPSVEVIKSLEGLKEFATQFKEVITTQKIDLNSSEVVERVEKLMEAYLAGIYIISRSLWDDTSTRGNSSRELVDHKAVLEQCIQGLFFLHSTCSQFDISTSELDKHILGSIFPSNEVVFHQFSPLLSHPRKLITSLQTQPTRPIAHSKLKTSVQSPIQSSFPESASDDEILYVISLLDTFLDAIEKIESLAGPIPAKNKQQREENLSRPLRIEMEVRVMKCDLLMSITTKRIGDVKFRALKKVTTPDEEEEEESKENADDAGNAGNSEVESEVQDIKPKLKEEDRPGSTGQEEHVSTDDTSRWENLAEESLVVCLESANRLLDEGRGEVLSDHIEAINWLGEEGIIRPEETKLDQKSKSPDVDGDSETEVDTEDEFDSESETSEELGGLAYPCPLRTIFRLHDRYEEQRLAVWLQLPVAKRGKMGWFMRGEDGRVGTIWDSFGLAAMMEYDSETLLRYGLGPDKLDKWLELASVKNAKKIKKRGKKSVQAK